MEHYEQYELLDAVYWIDFYCEVVEKATKMGYSEKQVEVFICDIRSHYDSGKTVDEVVDLIWGSR